MSDIETGYTFPSGVTFTSTKMNNAVNLATIKPGALSADSTGRAKMADGFLSADATGLAKMADGFLTADAAGRAKMADGYVTEAKMPAGSVVQVVSAEYATYTSTAAVIPGDDTVPLIGEGIELLSLSITPSSATNKILVQFSGSAANVSSGGGFVFAFFRGSTCIAAKMDATYTFIASVSLTLLDAPASASALTYSVRYGQNAAYSGAVINGGASGRQLGGAQKQILTLSEIKA